MGWMDEYAYRHSRDAMKAIANDFIPYERKRYKNNIKT